MTADIALINTSNGAAITPAADAAELAELLIRNSLAPHTQRAYGQAMRGFGEWRAANAHNAPPTTSDLTAYITAMAASGKKPATLQMIVFAVRRACAAANTPDITKHGDVRALLQGIKRAWRSTPQKQAAPLDTDIIAVAAAAAADEGTIRGLRDAAIIRLSYNALLRRSEISNFCRADFADDADGAAITIRFSKSDQTGKGAVIAVGKKTAAALRAWITAAPAADDGAPLFCRILRGDHVNVDGRMSVGAIYSVFKSRLGAKFSCHSARTGAACQLAADNIGITAIANRGRWRSTSMPIRYTRAISAKNCPAARAMAEC